MSRHFACLLILCVMPSAAFADQLHYSGQLETVSRNGTGSPVKEFTLTCLAESNGNAETFYHLDEGRPALPWIERYGLIGSSPDLLDPAGVAIGYRHLDRNYVLPVALPYFKDHDQLASESTWQNAQGEFAVTGEKTINGIPCWEVKATTGIARHHQLYIRKAEPIIESGSQTVFMGPGDRFRITFSRQPQEVAINADSSKLAAATEELLALQGRVDRDSNNRFRTLSGEQVKSLNELATQMLTAAKGTALETLANEIHEDLVTLSSRQDRLGTLAESMVDQKIPKFTLMSLKSKEISSSEFEGKPVVLHFWDYANPTLEQPYGQVGYLDFINNRWKDRGVLVYGVAINSELTDSETRAKAIRNIEQLKQFMKLSYEVTYDGGAVLNSFGNPTRLGEDLPLWVAISPAGKVVHYQTGFYDVDNRVGLKKLDSAIEEMLK